MVLGQGLVEQAPDPEGYRKDYEDEYEDPASYSEVSFTLSLTLGDIFLPKHRVACKEKQLTDESASNLTFTEHTRDGTPCPGIDPNRLLQEAPRKAILPRLFSSPAYVPRHCSSYLTIVVLDSR